MPMSCTLPRYCPLATTPPPSASILLRTAEMLNLVVKDLQLGLHPIHHALNAIFSLPYPVCYLTFPLFFFANPIPFQSCPLSIFADKHRYLSWRWIPVYQLHRHMCLCESTDEFRVNFIPVGFYLIRKFLDCPSRSYLTLSSPHLPISENFLKKNDLISANMISSS